MALTPPDPPLSDDVIRLLPMTQSDHDDLVALTADQAVRDFTYVPTGADSDFVHRWIDRYVRGWEDGSCAGFVARSADDGVFLAFASVVQLDLEARQGELGYAGRAWPRRRRPVGRPAHPVGLRRARPDPARACDRRGEPCVRAGCRARGLPA